MRGSAQERVALRPPDLTARHRHFMIPKRLECLFKLLLAAANDDSKSLNHHNISRNARPRPALRHL